MSNQSFSPKTVPVVKRTAPSDDIKINSQMFVFLLSSCFLSDILREGVVGPTVEGSRSVLLISPRSMNNTLFPLWFMACKSPAL